MHGAPAWHAAELGLEPRRPGAPVTANEAPVTLEEETRAPAAGAAVDVGPARKAVPPRDTVPPAPLPEGAVRCLLVGAEVPSPDCRRGL